MANPDLNTYGAGKYTGLMMAHRRGAERGGRQRKRRPSGVAGAGAGVEPAGDLRPGPLSAGGQTDRERPAVAGDRCGETPPRVADAGVRQSLGLPDAGGLALGELWMAKKLYPSRYQGIDVDSKAGDYYQRFTAWRGRQMRANHHPRRLQGSLALATLAIAVASLCFGQYPLSLRAVGHTLVHLPPGEGVIGQIVWSGSPAARGHGSAGRGRCWGCAAPPCRACSRTRWVDPHIIGVTAGSAFGGTLAILLGVGGLLMMASTFFFGLIALGLIYALAALQGAGQHAGADSVRDHSQRLLRRAGQPDAVTSPIAKRRYRTLFSGCSAASRPPAGIRFCLCPCPWR